MLLSNSCHIRRKAPGTENSRTKKLLQKLDKNTTIDAPRGDMFGTSTKISERCRSEPVEENCLFCGFVLQH
jgi:hypothetical protein